MTADEAPLVAPPWLGSVDDLEPTPARILLAAAELFSAQSPSRVSLRAIAARAGVNYGLIHHYFRTKDAILAELIRRASRAGAERMHSATTLDDALARLLLSDLDTTYGRMLAWSMLDDTDPSRLVAASPAIARISDLVGEALGPGSDVDPKVVAAVAVSAVLGWRLYRPFVTSAAALDDRDAVVVTAEVLEAIRGVVSALVSDGRRVPHSEPT